MEDMGLVALYGAWYVGAAIGSAFAAFAFIDSPLITEYIDVYFIVIIVVMFCVDRLEIRKLKAEIKQLKSKSSAE